MAYKRKEDMASNNIIKITLTDEESAYLKEQPRGYLRALLQKDMGGTPEIKPTKKVAESQPKKELLENLPVGVSVGIPARPDRPVCRLCRCNLDIQGRCSQKGCRNFLKVVK
jgi:hypothetical protein